MFHWISALTFLYVYFRGIAPLLLTKKNKLAIFLALGCISQQHAVMRLFGSLASPELPFVVLVVLGWLFISFILLALLLLLQDAANGLLLLARAFGPRWSLPGSRVARTKLLLILALTLAAYGEWEAIRVPDVHTVETTLERLPPALDGITLVQITDPHASALLRGPRVRAIVDSVMALDPDLILLTGDLVDGVPAKRASDVAPLGDLRARFGVFACTGNHEYYSDYVSWMRAFKELGLTMLENSHVVVTVRGLPMVIAGVTDPTSTRFNLPEPDVEAALAGAPAGVPVILLAHQPRNARANARAGVDLQLSGHTHGGHILGLHLISRYVNQGFVSGWYTLDKGPNTPGEMRLYVSPGAGLWGGFPVRLGTPAEITRIVLRSAQVDAAR